MKYRAYRAEKRYNISTQKFDIPCVQGLRDTDYFWETIYDTKTIEKAKEAAIILAKSNNVTAYYNGYSL